MSITAAVIVMIAAACIYVGAAFLNHAYNHGGRDPINALYSVSQWNPAKVELIGDCVIPVSPGQCVIEGLTGAYQTAHHWCALTDGPCIDPDTGENVKGNPIPFVAVCGKVPYCGWSQCIISFDGNLFVQVQPVAGPTGSTSQFKFNNVPAGPTGAEGPTLFYMERLAVGNGLVLDQNGTIARFYMLLAGDSNRYTLSYVNNLVLPGSQDPLTGLTIQRSDSTNTGYLTFFVLMESMPTTISTFAAPPGARVLRKILVFGGFNRTQDPPLEVLGDFNDHVQEKLWIAAQKYDLTFIKWRTLSPVQGDQGGFYGDPNDTYQRILIGWHTRLEYLVQQDVVESRLLGEPGARSRAFYSWIGQSS